ncbi:hypothetical protein B0J13DRAFT_523789 [Dactylonectria estremocensis]|uniref:Uncharacterized protein n=1 Tax=Dactylonectria estremocensis TaxID=1079267 RepID=A0A9P9EZM2_9HYPO|nr:hypothetical protein B0J13DRAFT_523789 [Dactylonectria estremocensis]
MTNRLANANVEVERGKRGDGRKERERERGKKKEERVSSRGRRGGGREVVERKKVEGRKRAEEEEEEDGKREQDNARTREKERTNGWIGFGFGGGSKPRGWNQEGGPLGRLLRRQLCLGAAEPEACQVATNPPEHAGQVRSGYRPAPAATYRPAVSDQQPATSDQRNAPQRSTLVHAAEAASRVATVHYPLSPVPLGSPGIHNRNLSWWPILLLNTDTRPVLGKPDKPGWDPEAQCAMPSAGSGAHEWTGAPGTRAHS